jgi:hypothetical protein
MVAKGGRLSAMDCEVQVRLNVLISTNQITTNMAVTTPLTTGKLSDNDLMNPSDSERSSILEGLSSEED